MYLLLWIFFVYAFLGWCTEVSFAALTSGRFVNRGFLNGPVCPIYGVGVVIVLFFLDPLRGNTFLLFLGSVLLTSLLEWVTGFVLEKIFHQRWWDYSNEPFNLGGYICLRFSIAWGLACLFVVEIIHPSILWLIHLIPHTLGLVLLACFGAVIAVDLAATGSAIARNSPPIRSPLGVFGRCFRRNASSALMAFPMMTTGCTSHAGSPNIQSSIKPPSIAAMILMPFPPHNKPF